MLASAKAQHEKAIKVEFERAELLLQDRYFHSSSLRLDIELISPENGI
jgi:hypothetical protein